MRLLDADILIDLLHRRAEAINWLNSLEERPAVPGHAALELLMGCRNLREQRSVETLLQRFTRVWPSLADQERAYETLRAVQLANRIGIQDAMIAETAKGLNAVLCTLNERHLKAVRGLVLEVPYRKAS